MTAFRIGRVARISLLTLAVACGDSSQTTKNETPAKASEPTDPTKPDPTKPGPIDPIEPADPKGPATGTPVAVATDGSVAALLASIGDGPMLSLVVRPQQWKAAGGALDAILGDAAPPQLRAITGASAGAELVEQLGRHMFGIDATKLEGIDPVRPWVGGYGEVADATVLQLPAVGAESSKFRSYGLRHVLLVPVTDGKAFIESFGPTFTEARSIDTWVSGSEPSFTGTLGTQGLVTAKIEGDYVRVVVFTHVHNLSVEEGKKALASRLGPTPATLEQTPAFRELTTRDSLSGVYVRPSRIRRWATSSARYWMLRATDHAPADSRASMLAAGLSALLTAEVTMMDEAAEVDDWAYLLEAKGTRIELLAVGSLTAHGTKMFDAVQTGVALLPSVASSSPLLEGGIRVDVDKMRATVPPHRILSKIETPESLQMLGECGSSCALHLMHRTPLQSLAAAISSLPAADQVLPGMVALQGQLLGLDTPSGALALITPTAATATAAKTKLETIDPSLTKKSTLAVVNRGSDSTLQVGFGVAPNTVFAAGERKSTALLELHGTVAANADTLDIKLPKAVFGTLKLERQGAALVAQLVASTDADPVADYTADPTPTTWNSPIVSAPGGDNAACVAEAANGVRQLFSTLATVAPETRSPMLNKGLEEMKDTFACPTGGPDTKARAAAMRALVEQLDKTLLSSK